MESLNTNVLYYKSSYTIEVSSKARFDSRKDKILGKAKDEDTIDITSKVFRLLS